MKKLLSALIFLLFALTATAQTVTWDQFADQYFFDTDAEEEGGVGLYDELLELHRNPLNINLAQRDDLLKMPFLSEAQADSILSHIHRVKGIYSLGELMFVDNLNHDDLIYLPLFFYCKRPESDTKYEDLEKGLDTELSTTLTVPLFKREGFRSHDPAVLEKSPNKEYLGSNLSTTLRYRSVLNNRYYWGLTAQKDEGEPFAADDNFLYDSYSFYIMGKHNSLVNKWILGDYRPHFALGLTIGASSVDASSILNSYNPRQAGFTHHTSTDEYNFLRGGAITLNHKALTLHLYASHRYLDATLTKDSISTIITNGYHRTPLEMSKRHNIQAIQGGLSAILSLQGITLSLQATHTHYDTPYRQPTRLYRHYYFRNQNFGNYSLYYATQIQKLKLWGEIATSLQGGIAAQQRILFTPSNKLKLIALYRYYTTHYLSTSAQSYKIGSRIQNEHGLLLGTRFQLFPSCFMSIYADYAHYPFATYYTDHAAHALTSSAELEYAPSRKLSFLLRYKYRQRPQDNDADQLDHKDQHTFKLQSRYTLGLFTNTTDAQLILLSQPDKSNTSGWAITHKTTANLLPILRLNVAAAVFHTDSYAEALRFYEPTMLYSTSSTSLYYHGQHFSLSSTLRLRHFYLSLKYSLTHYTNRTTIGTDLRAYNGSTIQTINIQGTLKF